MMVDQEKIEALKQAAAQPPPAAGSALPEPQASAGGATESPDAGGVEAPAADETGPGGRELAQILRLRVPIIVQLARRRLSIGQLRDLSAGSILEFTRSVDHDLDLLINNHIVGAGMCVKIGENFGLRIKSIGDAKARIRSLAR